jgi:hypothetical protein
MTKEEHITLLNEVFGHFQQITQWIPNNIEDTLKYSIKAETILDLLEMDLFGIHRSHFKRGHVHEYELCGNRLYDRFYFIVKELKCEEQIERICYFDVESMFKYFKQLCKLRESFNK